MKSMSLGLNKSSWVLTKLGDLAKDISKRVENPGESEYDRFVGLGNFVSGDIKIKSWETTKNLASSAKAFQMGDILFARRNAYLRRASLVDFDGCCSGDAFVLRENHDKVVPGFLAFLINSNTLWDFANSNAAGTMSKRVKWRDLAEYEFLLPPKEQQENLAELLWSIDKLIESHLFNLNKQKVLFLSYSQSIFAEGEGKYTELKDLGDLIMGQSPLGSTYNDKGDGMPFLQGNAEFGKVSPNHIKFTTAPNKIVRKGTILISVRAPVGDLNMANTEYCIGRGLAGLYIENIALRDYVYNFLKFSSSQFNKKSAGSTFKAINKNDLSSIGLVIPSSQTLFDNSSKINAIIDSGEKIESSIKSSRFIQKSLINQIF